MFEYISVFNNVKIIFSTILGSNESPKWSGLNSDMGSSPQPQGISSRVRKYTILLYVKVFSVLLFLF